MKITRYLNHFAKKISFPARISITLICLSSVAIIVTATVLSNYFAGTVIQLLSNTSIENINRVQDNFENMNDTAKSMLLNFHYDSQIQKLLSANFVDWIQLSKSLNKISAYYNHTPYLYSYYLINYNINYVFSNKGSCKMEEFYDQEILQMLEAGDANDRFRPIYRQIISEDDGQKMGVFTYIFFETYNNQIDSKAIVINISENYLLESMNKMVDHGACIEILNSNGDRIISSTAEILEAYQNVENPTQYFKKGNSGHSIESIHHQKTLLCYQSYANTTIVKYIPYTVVQQSIFAVQKPAFLISFMLLAIALIIALLSSRRISTSIGNLYSRIKQLEEENKKNLHSAKRSLLQEVLLNPLTGSPDKLQEKFEKQSIQVDLNSPICIAYCQIDHFQEFKKRFDFQYRNLLLYCIVNLSQDLFSHMALVDGIAPDEKGVVLFFSRLTDSFTRQNIQDAFKKLMQVFKQEFQSGFSVAVSDIGTASNIDEMYQVTTALIPYRFLLGHHTVIFSSDIASNENYDWQYPVEQEQQISKYISNRQREKAQSEIDLFLDSMRQITYEDAYSAIHRLIYSIQITVDSMRFSGANLLYDMQGLYKHFYGAEVLEEIKEAFHQELIRAENDMPKKSNVTYQKYEQSVEEAKLYIQQHYSDFNLSLDSIAESLQISAITLGRVFKALVGMPVFHYIMQVRMEQAENLLLHSDLTTKEIAVACGYENIPYLYTLFKKRFGLTPGEYRKKYGNEKI